MPRSAALISSTTKRCSCLRCLDECEQLAADRHAARNSGRQTRRAAEPDSGVDAIEQEQKVALVAARVRHAPRQRLVAQIGLRSVRQRHHRSLEIGAAAASARSHEHALRHRRMLNRLDQRPLVEQCAVGQQELDDVAPVENRRRIAANFSSLSARSSALDCSTISEVLDRRDQLPLGPHANRVLVHRLVDDRERHKRGQFEILQADADLGGALSDEADMRRSGDDFVDTARALVCTVLGELKRQPGDRRQFVPVKLRESEAKLETRLKNPGGAQ
jgi:hypothetical protein